jgi:hypothetical protein
MSATDLFGRLALPGLSTLDADNFVAVRLQEEAFERWRTRLASIVDFMPEGALGSEDTNRKFAQRARKMISPVLRQIRAREVSQFIRGHLRDSAVGFTAGVSPLLVGSMANAAINPKEALIELGASTATAILASVIFRSTARSAPALRGFHSLFEEPPALT